MASRPVLCALLLGALCAMQPTAARADVSKGTLDLENNLVSALPACVCTDAANHQLVLQLPWLLLLATSACL
jgi:hypothetical protein